MTNGTERARAQSAVGRAALMALACLIAAPAQAASAAVDLFYQRAVMTSADRRCGLFAPALGSALAAAQAQARGAALRSGADDEALTGAAARADAKVATVGCQSKDLAQAAVRVRTAFDGYSHLSHMTYPGDLSAWRADRTQAQRAVTWRLSQSADMGPDRAAFGLAGREGGQALVAVASFADGTWPYAARLVMRDVTRTPKPPLALWRAGADGRVALKDRAPPRQGARVILAESRTLAEPLLLPKGAGAGVAFRFPMDTVALLKALDPREAVALEFVFADGDQVRTAYIEVGDFAAGHAFLQTAQR